jgi:hypothetical protein
MLLFYSSWFGIEIISTGVDSAIKTAYMGDPFCFIMKCLSSKVQSVLWQWSTPFY